MADKIVNLRNFGADGNVRTQISRLKAHTRDGGRLRLGWRRDGVVRRPEAFGPPQVAGVAPFQLQGVLLEHRMKIQLNARTVKVQKQRLSYEGSFG